MHGLLKNEIFGRTQLEVISWFYTNDNSVHLSDPRYQMPMLFSKDNVISGSHPDNLVCG